MYDPTLRAFTEAQDLGPLNTSEMNAVLMTPINEQDPLLLTRFLLTINIAPSYVRDIAMVQHRDLKWWAELTREINGIDMFFPSPATVTSWLLFQSGKKQEAKDLIYLVLNKDNTYQMAVLLMKIFETANDDMFLGLDGQLEEAVKEQMPEWDKQVTEFRADSPKWKASATN
jgi:hypothetical protein